MDAKSTKETNKEDAKKKDETEVAFVKNVTWRHYMFFIIHMFQSVGGSIGYPVMSQYFYHKLNVDYFAEHNITFSQNASHSNRVGQCFVNKSTPEYLLQQQVQAINSQWSQWFSIAHGVPTILMVLLAGSWVDVLGRKTISLINMSSHIFKYLAYGLFMKFKLPTSFLLLGYFFEGFGGSYYLSILVNFAYTSDITPKNHKRAFFVVAVQNLYHIIWGLAHLGSGYFIRELGFFWPLVVAISVNVLAIILFIIIVPETIERGKLSDLSPLKSLKRITKFYVKKDQGKNRSRLQFWLCLLAFASLTQAVIGEFSLDTLFVLNSPFCWDPVKLGNYGAVMAFVNPFLSLIVLRLMQCFFSEELIAGLSLGFHIIRCILKALAKSDWMIYLGKSFLHLLMISNCIDYHNFLNTHSMHDKFYFFVIFTLNLSRYKYSNIIFFFCLI